MNAKLIVFSGIVTAAVGTGLGVVIANLAPTPYTDLYRHLDQKYAVIGAVAGLLVGASQESLRELKQQRDQEELNARYPNNRYPNRTILH